MIHYCLSLANVNTVNKARKKVKKARGQVQFERHDLIHNILEKDHEK